MEKITQEEFDKLPIENGIKNCPTADYSLIKNFGEWCSFSYESIFGNNSRFGDFCNFAQYCRFGYNSKFGGYCSFGENCKFENWCGFGERCIFGENCSFNEWCRFGINCRFSEKCVFDEKCVFEDGFFSLSRTPFLSFSGFGSRANSKTYVWNFKTPMVRCGCFFGTVQEFIDKVIKENADPFYLEIMEIMVKKLKSMI